MDSESVSWREARELITATGFYSVNEAQRILDDLAWFSWAKRSHSVPVGGEIRWLRYDDTATTTGPRYLLLKERPGD